MPLANSLSTWEYDDCWSNCWPRKHDVNCRTISHTAAFCSDPYLYNVSSCEVTHVLLLRPVSYTGPVPLWVNHKSKVLITRPENDFSTCFFLESPSSTLFAWPYNCSSVACTVSAGSSLCLHWIIAAVCLASTHNLFCYLSSNFEMNSEAKHMKLTDSTI